MVDVMAKKAEWPFRESWHGTDDYENKGSSGIGHIGGLDEDSHSRVVLFDHNENPLVKETTNWQVGFAKTDSWRVRNR